MISHRTVLILEFLENEFKELSAFFVVFNQVTYKNDDYWEAG
jgi:hypothetical protein